jgi:predicted acyltransferase
LEHVPWEGFRFYDLIFPLFLFLVGCVLPYSLDKYRHQPSRVYWRLGRRTFALVMLGLIANGLLDFQWSELRLAGVLQRIGICYGLGALIFLHTRTLGQSLAIGFILIGYWLLLRFVPAPGGLVGDLSMQGNLAGWVDRNYLPGKILEPYYGYGDNEGILSTIPAVATVLLGALTGRGLKSDYSPWFKFVIMLVSGGVLLAAGYAWGNYFPIIKNLWTSSFVLVAAGWSLLLLSLFYLIIDVIGYRGWAWGFTIIGVNAITIYFCQGFIDFEEMSEFFFGGLARLSGENGLVILLTGTLLAKFLFLWFLHAKRVYLRV